MEVGEIATFRSEMIDSAASLGNPAVKTRRENVYGKPPERISERAAPTR